MDVRIRPTQESDVGTITAIYAEAVLTGTASYEIDAPDQSEMLRRWQALDGFPHMVATSGGGDVLGYAYAGPYRARPAYRFTVEDSIYVEPAAQGMGIGGLLLRELVAASAARGFRQMIAVIGGAGENLASVALHRSCGFREIGVIEGSGFKRGRWLDTLLMQLALGEGGTTPPGDLKP